MYNMKDKDCPDDLFSVMKKAYRYEKIKKNHSNSTVTYILAVYFVL